MVTSSRPDIVIINRNTSPTSVFLVELTVPFSKNIEAANARKRARYEFLTSDITEAGFSCSNIPLEVCSRGQITSRNRETLLFLCHTFGIRKFQQVIRNCSKLALLGSYAIYLARNGSDWSGSGLLTPWTHLLSTLYSLYNCNLCYGGGAIVPPFVNPENCLAILLVSSKIRS